MKALWIVAFVALSACAYDGDGGRTDVPYGVSTSRAPSPVNEDYPRTTSHDVHSAAEECARYGRTVRHVSTDGYTCSTASEAAQHGIVDY